MATLFDSSRPGVPPEPTTTPTGVFVQVVVHRGIERASGARGGGGEYEIDSALTYAVQGVRGSQDADASQDQGQESARSADLPRIGQLVRVPLGKGNKPATGVVVEVGGAELLGDLAASRVKAILEVTPAIIPGKLVELARWLAGYYVCPLGMVLVTMLPAAVKKQVGRKPVRVLSLVAKAFTAEGAGGAEKGAVEALPKRLREAWVSACVLDPALWPLSAKALHGAVPSLSLGGIKKLVTAGLLVERVEETVSAHHDPLLADAMAGPRVAVARPVLTADQSRAISAIEPTLDRFGVHLLRGVTGSGKTEVYLQLIERVLNADAAASAIILVPEIALTPQTSRRFLDRFGAGSVAVLHSALSASQRHAQWDAAAAGRVRVVVGARSAIFAPLPKLRLIVVDEEHDGSYKQDQLPRYHARDVAVKRAQLESCAVLLGSATPSLESWANARASDEGAAGKYVLHELPTRVAGATLPRVQIVDLMNERKLRAKQHEHGVRDRQLHLLGPTLEKALEETLAGDGQALLLLNRRGYASYLCCPDPKCGFVMRCDHCDATVVYHRGEDFAAGGAPGVVRCHHCLAEVLLPKACPVCRTKKLNTFGLGTQRVEEELSRKFASMGLVAKDTLLRLDSDTMRSARDYFAALDRFARGDARVLLGTQMIAKGLDFPNVQLVGIVSADTALGLPDFRSHERTFQLVCQVAGRAGRRAGASREGLVIVQTVNPTAPPIVLAAQHDFTTFAEQELAVRRASRLPPITRMARIVCRDLVQAKAAKSAADLVSALRAAVEMYAKGAVTLRGPMPCPIARIDDHHRIAIELTAASRGAIQTVMGEVRRLGLLKSDSHTAVDVDPIALL